MLIDSEDNDFFNSLKEKMSNHLSTDNQKVVKEFIGDKFYDSSYFLVVDNGNGILLLLYNSENNVLYSIENISSS